MVKILSLKWKNLKKGNGVGAYAGSRFVGLVREHVDIKGNIHTGKFILVCPYRKIETLFDNVEDGKIQLAFELVDFIKGITNEQVFIIGETHTGK